MPDAPNPFFLTEPEFAERYRISRSALQKMRHFDDPSGPPFARIGVSIRYPFREAEAWAQARIVAARSAGGRS